MEAAHWEDSRRRIRVHIAAVRAGHHACPYHGRKRQHGLIRLSLAVRVGHVNADAATPESGECGAPVAFAIATTSQPTVLM